MDKSRGHRTRSRWATRRSNPAFGAPSDSHVSAFESHTLISNGHFQTTRCGQMGTRCVRCTPDPYAERVFSRVVTGRGPPDLSYVRCHLLENSRLRTSWRQLHQMLEHYPARVRCERPMFTLHLCEKLTIHRTLGPASDATNNNIWWVFFSEKHSRDFSKLSTGAIENMCFIFLKALNPAELEEHKPLSALRNPPPSQSVPTPPSVYQHVQVC